MTFKDKLKKHWEEDPVQCIAIASGVVIAATGVLNAVSAAQGRRAYSKQVNYRVNRPYDDR